MPKKNPAKKRLWKRVESFGHLKKAFLIGGLGLSNLAVLGFALGMYFQSREPGERFFSHGDRLDHNFERIEKDLERRCRSKIDAVQSGEKDAQYCSVELKQKYGRASYTVKQRFKIEREGDGEQAKIVFTSANSRIRGGTGFASKTEGKYCEDCKAEMRISAGGMNEFMSQFIDLARDAVYEEMREALDREKTDYDSRESDRKAGLRKERNCEGDWDEGEGYFTPFDFEGQMSCETRRLSQIPPMERDNYYYQNIQPRLWEAVRSDDSDLFLDGDFWNQFNDPFRHSFSVRASAGLLKKYHEDWRNTFNSYEDEAGRQAYLKLVREDARQYLRLLPPERAEADLYNLNRGFRGHQLFKQDFARGATGSAGQLIQQTNTLY